MVSDVQLTEVVLTIVPTPPVARIEPASNVGPDYPLLSVAGKDEALSPARPLAQSKLSVVLSIVRGLA